MSWLGAACPTRRRGVQVPSLNVLASSRGAPLGDSEETSEPLACSKGNSQKHHRGLRPKGPMLSHLQLALQDHTGKYWSQSAL